MKKVAHSFCAPLLFMFWFIGSFSYFLILLRLRLALVHFLRQAHRWSGRFVRRRASGTWLYPRREPRPSGTVIHRSASSAGRIPGIELRLERSLRNQLPPWREKLASRRFLEHRPGNLRGR